MKLTEIKNLNTDYILNIGRDNDYALCTEVGDDGNTLIQDEDSLSELLSDLGLMFLENDSNNMYYHFNNMFIGIPYQLINYEEDECDCYLDFDELETVEENTLVNDKKLVDIRDCNIALSISNIVDNFLNENKVMLDKESLLSIKKNISEYSKDLFKKETNYDSLKKTVSLACEIIDIVEDVLSDKNIYIDCEEREGNEEEACIYGSVYYDLEDTIVRCLEKYIID